MVEVKRVSSARALEGADCTAAPPVHWLFNSSTFTFTVHQQNNKPIQCSTKKFLRV